MLDMFSPKLGSSMGFFKMPSIAFHRFDHLKRKREGREIRNGDRESHFPSEIVSSTRRSRQGIANNKGEENKVRYAIKFLRLSNGVNNSVYEVTFSYFFTQCINSCHLTKYRTQQLKEASPNL